MSELQARNAAAMLEALASLRAELADVRERADRLERRAAKQESDLAALRQTLAVMAAGAGSGPTAI